MSASSPPPNSLSRRRVVVIVDDEYNHVAGIEFALQDLGWEVHYADNGNAGLALITTIKPDLVMLDLGMEGRSGFLVLEYLRSRESVDCFIFVLTALDGNRHLNYAVSLGVDAYFLKPCPVEEVTLKARELLC